MTSSRFSSKSRLLPLSSPLTRFLSDLETRQVRPLVICRLWRLQPPPSDWAERGSPSGNAVGPLIPVISTVPMATERRFSQTNNGRMFIRGRTDHSGRSACLPLSPDSDREVG